MILTNKFKRFKQFAETISKIDFESLPLFQSTFESFENNNIAITQAQFGIRYYLLYCIWLNQQNKDVDFICNTISSDFVKTSYYQYAKNVQEAFNSKFGIICLKDFSNADPEVLEYLQSGRDRILFVYTNKYGTLDQFIAQWKLGLNSKVFIICS